MRLLEPYNETFCGASVQRVGYYDETTYILCGAPTLRFVNGDLARQLCTPQR